MNGMNPGMDRGMGSSPNMVPNLKEYGSYESTEPNGLPVVKKTELITLTEDSTYTITAEKVQKKIAGRTVAMYGYNRMIPGPLFIAKKGMKSTVVFENKLDKPSVVHWHGLRGNYLFDGVPGLGQNVVMPSESFTYKLEFPDDGVYWYHSHVRGDAQQDLGLSGNIFVSGLDEKIGAADASDYLLLDDILLDQTGIVPYGETVTTFAIMGRYGNILLVNGDTEYARSARTGEVLRLYFTNAASVRPFNIQIPGARMKLVAGDNGAYLRQEFITNFTISPGERYVIDVVFDKPGKYELRADNPLAEHLLGTFSVTSGEPTSAAQAFNDLKVNAELAAEISRLQSTINGPVDRDLLLDINIRGMDMMGMEMEESHEGIEWEDTMAGMAVFTNEKVEWIIRDNATGLQNKDVTIKATIGDSEKWRITNIANNAHPMQHPIHLHGQRFLVTAIDGEPVTNPVWKDVVLVPIGHTVDIVVDYTNAGEWMLHCHIAEHMESGMFTYVSVAEKDGMIYPKIGEEMH